MAKAKKATKHPKAGAAYKRATLAFMKKRKEGAERAALFAAIRNEDAALRKMAADQTIAAFRQQGWLSGM